jgi:hypothetical protein
VRRHTGARATGFGAPTRPAESRDDKRASGGAVAAGARRPGPARPRRAPSPLRRRRRFCGGRCLGGGGFKGGRGCAEHVMEAVPRAVPRGRGKSAGRVSLALTQFDRCNS